RPARESPRPAGPAARALADPANPDRAPTHPVGRRGLPSALVSGHRRRRGARADGARHDPFAGRPRPAAVVCGIVGVLSPAPVSGTAVAAMRDTLAHRGPDHAGLWRSDDGRVCLGHRRLAVLDLTPEANQPFVSHDRRLVVTLNGEIYNHAELRRELEAEGVVFRTRSDTEVLLETFRRWRTGALARLSGMFAFAIWDTQDHRLFCARDRSGEKPLYYASIDGTFLFGSE